MNLWVNRASVCDSTDRGHLIPLWVLAESSEEEPSRGTLQKVQKACGRGGRCPAAISSHGSAAPEPQLQAGATRTRQRPSCSRLLGEGSTMPGQCSGQLEAEGELEGAVFPLARRSSCSALACTAQGSTEPLGPVATSPLASSFFPWTLMAQQRADINVVIAGNGFSEEAERC